MFKKIKNLPLNKTQTSNHYLERIDHIHQQNLLFLAAIFHDPIHEDVDEGSNDASNWNASKHRTFRSNNYQRVYHKP